MKQLLKTYDAIKCSYNGNWGRPKVTQKIRFQFGVLRPQIKIEFDFSNLWDAATSFEDYFQDFQNQMRGNAEHKHN